MRFLFPLILALNSSFFLSGQSQIESTIPIPYGHAHNDYEHSRPLLDALDAGFTSIEVDLHFIKGEFYVSHDRPLRLDKEKTLEKLYLQPLQNRFDSLGSIYPGYRQRVYLMLDLKTNDPSIFESLKKEILPYKDLFCYFDGTFERPAPMVLFISGHRPVDAILADSMRLLRLDGRPDDLGKGIPSSWMPIVSDQYLNHSKWKGRRDLPEADRVHIAQLIYQTHQEGKELRFWNLPANIKVWNTYLKLGLDWINTDDLIGLQTFYLENEN